MERLSLEGENPQRVIVPNDDDDDGDDDEKRVIHIHKDTKSRIGRRKMYFM